MAIGNLRLTSAEWRTTVSLGRFAWRACVRQGSDQVERGAELGQAHAEAVQEVLQGKIAVQGVVAVLAQVVGQLGDELAVGPLQDRYGLAAGLGEVGEIVAPAGE